MITVKERAWEMVKVPHVQTRITLIKHIMLIMYQVSYVYTLNRVATQ